MGLVETDKPLGVERVLPRHQFEARVKIEVMRERGTSLTEGWARDLSESGLGAFVGMQLVVGELATLRIPLQDEVETRDPRQNHQKLRNRIRIPVHRPEPPAEGSN